MTNSRRGFLASLLALLPFAKSVQAGGGSKGTIRLFNGSPQVGGGLVAQSITNTNQFLAINSGSFVDFKGTPGSTTAVSCIKFEDQTIFPAIYTTFPLPGKIKTYSFYYTQNTTTGAITTVIVAV